MYRIAKGTTQGLKDVERFIHVLNDPFSELTTFFDSRYDISVSRAPGRLDGIGGIADYSGSLVLEMPIAEATIAAVQKSDDRKLTVRTISRDGHGHAQFEISLSHLVASDYDDLRAIFAADKTNHWASYVVGVFPILVRECGFEFESGARILISSNVPPGKGVSSSAALEVATMQAVCTAFGFAIEPRQLALLCQKVENLIVGAPCGVMDQITSHCGVENSLISLLCQPAEIRETIRIPIGIELWGIDSGVRHAVTGSDYSAVRTAAFMGYRIIAGAAGLKAKELEDGIAEIDDPRWHGYLCNISPQLYEQDFSAEIPETMRGSEFIEKYGGITDRVTTIDPARTYPLRAATEFPINENDRAARFADLLKSAEVLQHLDELGELMFASHAGYAACGLTEPGTERLVELVHESHGCGLLGARITGGGSGGTVAVLGASGSRHVIAEIARQYAQETGHDPHIFSGSSLGCAEFGSLTLTQA